MREIVRLAEGAGAWIVADEVYQGAELDGRTTPSFWGRYDKLFVVNGLSKAYGLPGLRIGWIAGPDAAVQATWPYHDYTTISPSALSDRLATFVLAPGSREKILERTRTILRRNFPVLEGWLKSQPGIFEFVPPRAGAICFARYGLPVNSTVLVERLIREKSVLVVPGDHFETDGHLRFGFGSPEAYLTEALGRVAALLGQIRGS